jgi:FAD/FMN-containing dehydrogenase
MVKFGKAKHLKDAPAGRWRIAPASSYSDPSLDPARHDHELRRTVYGLPNEVEITIPNEQTGEPIAKTHPIGNVTVTQESLTDYYVMCLSRSLSLRLFDDFNQSDACVIIRDIGEFARRIFAAFRKLLPDWDGTLRDVVYYDPFNAPRNRDLFYSKHFRYAYQTEVRFVWTPHEPRFDLKFHDLEAGPMTDICDFLALPE